MSGRIMTVTGPIAPEALGLTLMHEHIICDITPLPDRGEPPVTLAVTLPERYRLAKRPADAGVYRLKDEATAIAELKLFRAAGGSVIVDLTTGGIAPDPNALARISAASGVRIVLGAGYYYDAYVPPDAKALSVEALTELMIAQMHVGAWGTAICCGMIGEIGTSWPITPFEERSLIAAARTQAATGAAINIHPGRAYGAPFAVCDILEAAGADLDRVIMSHMDRTYPTQPEMVERLARRCIVEYDFFGIESSYWSAAADLPTDAGRLAVVRRLFDAGLSERVIISQDICTVTRYAANGGHGYAHLITDVAALMQARGFSANDVEQLLIGTPRRLLTN